MAICSKTINHRKRIIFPLVTVLVMMLLGGCADKEREQVFLTTGFSKDEVFIIKDIDKDISMTCTLPEAYVYLANTKCKYEDVYGSGIWGTSVDGVSMPENIKDNVIFELSQIKAMNILAAISGIELSEEDDKLVNDCTNDYYSSLSSNEVAVMNVNRDVIYGMYREYALAEKLYRSRIADINPEISDDEARTITVQHVFIKTYTIDRHGDKVDYSPEAKKIAYDKACMIHDLATDGEHDFKDLVLQYSDGDLSDYSFGKNDTEPEFEQAAFDLGNDEISDVVETDYGYHIIKCISTFNREETDLNKVKLSEVQRQEVFGEDYDDYARTLSTYFNDELWDSISVSDVDGVNTQSFFEVYHTYFE
ncbi:MAG: peptidylprolyl isomerase [Lachnospiraceae bacterium]|nr:peptidylprolyl isomerase [Lachnospiraceae bacterium]